MNPNSYELEVKNAFIQFELRRESRQAKYNYPSESGHITTSTKKI